MATALDLGLILVAIEVVVIIAVSITAGEWVRLAAVRLAKRAGASPEVTGAIRDAVRALWIVGTIAGVLIVTGVANSFQALTIGGLAGLTVSLALQSTLSNILASILFFNDNTLRLNDIVSYGGIRGAVIRISLRTTWIKSDDGNITIVSNNTLMNGPFTNYTAKERLMKKLYM
ncbi:MAG TPA: mechanosensitive ion channel domain-containing protein [Candidatus Bathyarchaeia archaeon]|nr:mechanosensitive ion channel domain-containing protein [Candidatus Bathyarchaeia archaeon]